VSDNGVTSVDPVAGGAAAAGVGGAPTALGPTTQQYGPQAGGFPPQQGGYDPYGSGQVPPAKPARSGPSTGLIVGLAAVAVAVIVGLAFILTSGGDDDGDDTAADDIASSGTTEPGGDAADGDTGLGDLGDLGENGEDVSTDGIVELIASGIELEADGLVTHEQAVCAAQAMVDHFGVEGLIEAGGNGEDPFATASAEDQAAIITAMTDCIPVDVLAQIGMAQSEGG
jgi:hypothetical protein